MLRLANVNLDMQHNHSSISILKDINLDFKEGKMYAITGPNGGGKTSLARIMFGAHIPTSGNIYLGDKDITQLGISERAKMGIAYAFQQPPRFKGLTVEEMLRIASGCQGANGCMRRIKTSLREVGLCPEDYLGRELDASLSGGEMKRIELATVLIRKPKLSILDEPEAGIDLWSYARLVDVLTSSRGDNKTIVVITHQENIMVQADEIIVLAKGQVLERGNPATIIPMLKEDAGLCKWRMSCAGDLDVECN